MNEEDCGQSSFVLWACGAGGFLVGAAILVRRLLLAPERVSRTTVRW